MGGWMVIELFMMLMPLVAARAAFALLNRWSVGYTQCAKCQYSSQGMMHFICPECGSDVRQVGLVRIGGSLRRAAALSIGVWLFAAAQGYFIYRQELMKLIPTVATSTLSATLNGGRSGAFRAVTITGTIESTSAWMWSSSTTTLLKWNAVFTNPNWSAPGTGATLDVDDVAGTVTFRSGATIQKCTTPVGEEQLIEWLHSQWDQAYMDALKKEVAVILAFEQAFKSASTIPGMSTPSRFLPPNTTGVFSGVGTGNSIGVQAAIPWIVTVVNLIYAALALAGAVAILFVARRRLETQIACLSRANLQPITAAGETAVIGAPRTPSPPSIPGPRP